MFTTSESQSLIHLISQIQSEEIRQNRDQRSQRRQKICLPVIICQGKQEEPIQAISRDVTESGIGLLTIEEIPVGCIQLLQIQYDIKCSHVVSQCKWCQPFGPFFFASGWEFRCVSEEDFEMESGRLL